MTEGDGSGEGPLKMNRTAKDNAAAAEAAAAAAAAMENDDGDERRASVLPLLSFPSCVWNSSSMAHDPAPCACAAVVRKVWGEVYTLSTVQRTGMICGPWGILRLP